MEVRPSIDLPTCPSEVPDFLDEVHFVVRKFLGSLSQAAKEVNSAREKSAKEVAEIEQSEQGPSDYDEYRMDAAREQAREARALNQRRA